MERLDFRTATEVRLNMKERTLQIHNDAAPAELLEAVSAEIDRRNFKYGWRSHLEIGYAHWSCVFGGLHRLNRESIFDDLPMAVQHLWEHVKEKHAPQARVIRAYANAYTFGTEGSIHTDSKNDTDLTFLFYLNKEWHRDWAGETLFFHGHEVVKAVAPKYNRLCLFSSNIDHVARSVARTCPIARVIFTFKAATT